MSEQNRDMHTNANEFLELLAEPANVRDCYLCNEVHVSVGETTSYGSIIIARYGSTPENQWIVTLSPKTGSDPHQDFTLQLMPALHLTHFCQISCHQDLARNYGVLFSATAYAATQVLSALPWFEATTPLRDKSAALAVYGKCTTWHEKKEHLHIKVFPFRGVLSQPFTVDSSYGKKEVFNDNDEPYVKMSPVTKHILSEQRLAMLKAALTQAFAQILPAV